MLCHWIWIGSWCWCWLSDNLHYGLNLFFHEIVAVGAGLFWSCLVLVFGRFYHFLTLSSAFLNHYSTLIHLFLSYFVPGRPSAAFSPPLCFIFVKAIHEGRWGWSLSMVCLSITFTDIHHALFSLSKAKLIEVIVLVFTSFKGVAAWKLCYSRYTVKPQCTPSINVSGT